MAARRNGWKYIATRLNGDGTEDILDPDVPIEDVTIEDTLSGDNSISGKIDPVYARMLGPDGRPLFDEWSTAIYAENNGSIRGGGIIVNSDFDGPEWVMEAVGFTNYGRDMPYVANGYKGIEVDPIDVARVIWNHIQSRSGGNLGLTFDNTKSGLKIGTELKQVEFDTKSGPVSFESGPYKLNWYNNHDLMGDFDDLANNTPFDYHERHFWKADGTIGHHIDIGYPRLGKRREDIRLVQGVNILGPTPLRRSGETYASGTMVLGAGDGPSMIKAIKEPVRRPGGRLRRVAVVVDDTIKTLKKANQRADAENQWRSKVENIETVVVYDHPSAPLGSIDVGDEVYIEGRGDWVDLGMWVRVLSIAMQPANGNSAEYTVARTDMLTS